jgi:hypothetical protein
VHGASLDWRDELEALFLPMRGAFGASEIAASPCRIRAA